MQVTDTLILVDPSGFRYRESGTGDNYFVRPAKFISHNSVMKEFKNLISTLDQFKISYRVYKSLPNTPSGVFPNNWISFHWECDSPTIVVYPMKAKHRRYERGLLTPILTDLLVKSNMNLSLVNNVIDLAYFERSERYLESTGSLVLDRQNKIAYACYSKRTCDEVLNDWAQKWGINYVHLMRQMS